MPFEKKPIEEKMQTFCTTLKPEAYLRLKKVSDDRGEPMSIILSNMILKHLPKMDMWDAIWWMTKDDRDKKRKAKI